MTALGKGQTLSQGRSEEGDVGSWARTPGGLHGSAVSERAMGDREKGIMGRKAGPAGRCGAEMERRSISQRGWGLFQGPGPQDSDFQLRMNLNLDPLLLTGRHRNQSGGWGSCLSVQ